MSNAARSWPPRRAKRRRGLLMIFTGDGKGKTTAALGAALRAIGHGLRVLVVQFVKGTWKTGEDRAAPLLRGRLTLVAKGAGFVRTSSSAENKRHRLAAQAALRFAEREGMRGRYGLVVLDELNCAVSLGLLTARECMRVISRLLRTRATATGTGKRANERSFVNVIVTGRNAPAAFVRAADTVSEMVEVKHPYRRGMPAQKGLDY